MNNIISSYFEKMVKMNELFLKHVDNVTCIKCYKIDSDLFIVKLILWNKHTVCFIVKDEKVKQLWETNDDYVIQINYEFKIIRTFTNGGDAISFDFKSFKKIRSTNLISYKSIFPTWDERII